MKKILTILLLAISLISCTKKEKELPTPKNTIVGNYTDGTNLVSVEDDNRFTILTINGSRYNAIPEMGYDSYIVEWNSTIKKRIGLYKSIKTIDTVSVIINYESMGRGKTDSIEIMLVGRIK